MANRNPLAVSVLMLLLLAASAPVPAMDHSGPISVDETWSAVDNPHVIVAHVTVEPAATLTIEPGVEVRVVSNQRLYVDGFLDAVGLPGQEILFTRDGTYNWGYVYLRSGGDGTFAECTIEGSNYGLYVQSAADVDVASTTFRDCTYGVYKLAAARVGFDGCVFEDNTYGIWVSDGSVDLRSCAFSGNTNTGFHGSGVAPAFLDAGTTFTDNATGLYVNGVPGLALTTPLTVTGSTSAGVSLVNCDAPTVDNLVLTGNGGAYGALHFDDCGEVALGAGNVIGGPGLENSWPLSLGAGSFPTAGSAIPATGNTRDDIQIYGGASDRVGTWRRFAGLDYVVNNNATVSAGGALTIEPDVTVRLGASRRLFIDGSLTAIGSPGQEIVFTRDAATDWSYLYFRTAGGGTLEHCLFEHASYGVYAQTAGDVDLVSTTIRDCNYGVYAIDTDLMSLDDCDLLDNTYGIYATGGAVELTSVVFDANATTGFHGLGVAPTFLDANTTFTGNGTGLFVSGVPALSLTSPLSVTVGTVCGIHLADCDAPTLDGLTLTGNGGTYGALYLDDCGEAVIGAGNVIGGAGLENSWPVSIGAGTFLAAGSVIPTTGNDRDDIQVYGGASARTGTWRLFAGLDYVVNSNATVSAGGALTLEPGVAVRLGSSRRLFIDGTLTAVGAPGQEIVFTRDTATDWSYLSFRTAGGGTLEHCLVEHATYGVYAQTTGDVDVVSTTVRDCTYGVYATSTDGLGLADCVLQDNTYGVYATGGAAELTSVAFTDNTTAGFRGLGVAPAFLDANTTFAGNGTGLHVSDVAGATLTTPVSVTGSTTVGVHLADCEAPQLDNLALTGNDGLGALLLDDCGEAVLGAGNVIGGPGLENAWPLALGLGTYPTAGSVIPTTGNVRNDVQIYGGASARTGTLRAIPGLDYVVTQNMTVSAGGELILAPGATLRFEGGRRLFVDGVLTAAGLPGQEVVLTRDADVDWSYLYFRTAGSGTLENCVIEHANYGAYVQTSGAVALTGTTIRDCNYGVYGASGTITLLNARIVDNASYGLWLTDAIPVFGTSLAEWNDIHGNGVGYPGRDLWNGPNELDAVFVYWGTYDHGEILGRIWDWHDDHDRGFVHVLPYVNETHDQQSTSVDDPGPPGVPAAFALHGNAPNPFNPATEIRFDLPAESRVRLTVHDLSGARVATLLDGRMPAGRHARTWRGRDDRGRSLPSGMYVYRIEAGEDRDAGRMMLVR